MPIYTGPIDNILGSRDMHWKPGPTAPDSVKNRDFYTLYNEETRETEVKERNLLDPTGATDTYLGKWDKNKKFIPVTDLITRQPVNGPQQQYLASPEGTKVGLRNAQLAARKDLIDNGSEATGFQPVSEEEATKLTKDISNPNTGEPADGDDDGTTKPASDDVVKSESGEDREGTRNNFGTYMYPLTLGETTQDIIKFDMLKYRAQSIGEDKKFGSTGRKKGTTIGSVILPIPGGIKDSNKAIWGDDSMNSLEMAAANFAKGAIQEGATGANAELNKIGKSMKNAMGKGGGGLSDAITTWFTAAAVGKDFSKLMSRTSGQIMNPNMELLFSGPSLRPFSFSFLLAPRNRDEAEEVVQIIRFFKQGMAPIRSQANLFLKSPHTFKLQYKHRGEEHPYLNKFKECALKNCSVNYTPEQSYSTYEDGVMTAYSMTLEFTELEPVYNDDYGDKGKDLPIEIGY